MSANFWCFKGGGMKQRIHSYQMAPCHRHTNTAIQPVPNIALTLPLRAIKCLIMGCCGRASVLRHSRPELINVCYSWGFRDQI